ncbi:MAG: rod shape-determining protein [Chloroflexi bacterium]|nr:rod shape-determining protein [Chloroflexota bacterium]
MNFNPLRWLFGLFALDIGIDLGTANTLVYVRGKGIVLNEPSWVALDKRTRRPLYVGSEAKRMVGRTPQSLQVVRPVRDGVIAEFEITTALLEYLILKAHEQSFVPFPRPRVVVGIPAGVTEVEMRAVYDAALTAGAREAYLIPEPLAAALGAGLPIQDVEGTMIVDIGGGTTEVALLSMGGIIVARSLRVAGDEMDEAIIQYFRNKYNLLIGPRMAETVKMEIGSAAPLPEERTMQVRGRSLVTGLPEVVEASSVEIREALARPLETIIQTVKDVLDEAPPEVVADLIETGVCLAGGGALLQGLDRRLSDELRLRVWVADDPMAAVARGAGMVLEDFDNLKRLLVDVDRFL